MSKRKKLLLGGVGIVVILALIIILDGLQSDVSAVSVETEQVSRGQVVQKVNATGDIQPAVEVDISPKVGGEIMEMAVSEGDSVVRGQFLVQLDQEQYQASVERAQSSLKSAQAQLKLAQSELKRIQGLYEKGLSSEAELEQAEASVEQAEASLSQQRASLASAQDDLSKTRLTAPITGIVTNLEKEVGEIAMGSDFQSDVVMTISDLSTMEVVVEVDESDVVDVSLGDSVEVEVTAIPDTVFTGRVTEIAHSAVVSGAGTQQQVVNFEVTITLDDRIPQFRPGMTADVAIVTDIENNAIMVPIQAVTVRQPIRLESSQSPSVEQASSSGQNQQQTQNSGTAARARANTQEEVVFVVNQNDMTVEQRKVRTGISSDTHFEIVSGLEDGDEIVIGSYQAVSRDLSNGSKIERTRG